MDLFGAAYPLLSGAGIEDVRGAFRPAMGRFGVANRAFAAVARADVRGTP
ncbi:hypothetical protein ABZ883_22185 [Streptomyces sp. NPDC046977]